MECTRLETARRRQRVGTGIPVLVAAARVDLPLEEVDRLVRKGEVFSMFDLVSEAALPLLEERRAELLRRNRLPSRLGRNIGPVMAGGTR